MGHLGLLKEEYRDLLHRLEAGTVAMPEPETPEARAAWQEILEILYTPEEAALASRLPVKPSALEVISARVGIPPEELGPRLDAMAEKGLVMDLVKPKTGETLYLLSPPVIGFFEFSMMRVNDFVPKKRMAEALEAYAHGSDQTFLREAFGYDTNVGRAVAHESALGGEVPDVLDWERTTALVDDARTISVNICFCRHKAEHLGRPCAVPMENCISLNTAAEFVIRRDYGRQVERSEAHDILTASREAGLVHIADNVKKRPAYICSCCGCCCGQLDGINRFDLPAVNPSGFLPWCNLDKCKGCSRCSRACPIGAIKMVPRRVAGTLRSTLDPQIDIERCIGCGVCVGDCRKDAMHMERRTQRPFVPESAFERAVRQTIERGRLADLLFDEGASRGSRFLNNVVQVLTKLPAVEQALAQEQVKSRFVRYTMGGVPWSKWL